MYIREKDMLKDAPDSAIGGSYNVKSSKGGRRVFAGGCIRRPSAPVNGKIKCSPDRYLEALKNSNKNDININVRLNYLN